MENGTKIILSTSINVQPNPCIKRSIVCKYACCRICLYDNRYYVQIVKYIPLIILSSFIVETSRNRMSLSNRMENMTCLSSGKMAKDLIMWRLITSSGYGTSYRETCLVIKSRTMNFSRGSTVAATKVLEPVNIRGKHGLF